MSIFLVADDISFYREYADEALKQGKVFTELAKETLEDVAAETIKSKLIRMTVFEHQFHFSRCKRIRSGSDESHQ